MLRSVEVVPMRSLGEQKLQLPIISSAGYVIDEESLIKQLANLCIYEQ